ncbi:MAG: hypothetical protein KKA97_10370, partial [Actinobacteria bacterium]|nr:hypothetical protein [Actinomycetota bacterium]
RLRSRTEATPFFAGPVFHWGLVLHRGKELDCSTMPDLLHVYHQLTIMLIGLGLVFGLLSRKRAFHKLRHVVLMMVAVPVGISVLSGVWAATPVLTRFAVAAAGLLVAVPLALFRTSFGREVLAGIVGNALYDGVRRPGCLPGFVLLVLALAIALALLT